ncbi:BlaI/MecI/CopY family transcriptional regulator [Nocardioides sp.]|uniref:Transcriptional regulator blaI n=1 Tax=metagenome TaxID=256318 RepID=A0A2P2BX38_9ZZZZ
MRNLGQLEAVIMDRLWSATEPLSVRDVADTLSDDQSRAYTTVMTVLDNLFRKSFVTRELSGRAYRYRPVHSREQHTASVMEELLSAGGDRGATLLHFVEQMSADEASKLQEALRQHSEDNGT